MKLMRRIVLGLCAFAAVICIASVKPAQAEAASKFYVTTKEVSIRSKASSKASEVIKLPKEAIVKVIEKTNSSWYEVEYQNSKQVEFDGYISTGAIKEATAYTTKTASHIRKEKKKSSASVAVIPEGKTVYVVNTSSDWYKVVYYASNGKVYRGYTKNTLLKKVATAVTYKATTDVWMRQSASASSKAIMVIPKGVSVKVTSTSNSKWYKVSYTNSKGKTYTGYIRSTYLKKA